VLLFGIVLKNIDLWMSGELVVWEIVFTSLSVTGAALIISAAIGIPAGALMGLTRFPGWRVVVTLVYTGMGLPPVVVGLAIYLLVSHGGPLGSMQWLFTPAAMIMAQVVLAFPMIAGLTMAALDAVDPDLRLQIRSLGATSVQETIALLGEAREGIVASVVAGFGAIISEVGAAMLVGGNIEGQTRVLSTAIMLETRRGAFGLALALGGVLLSIAFAINLILLRLQRRPGGRWR
jgi:tungstate transport system permease protein